MDKKTQDKDTNTAITERQPFEPVPIEIKTEYQRWLAKPKEKRQPVTKQEFARQHGITYQSLLNWEQDPYFADSLRIHIRNTALSQASDVIEAVRKRALGEADAGSARHAELFLENVAGFGKRQEIDVTTRQEKTNTAELLTSGRMAEQLEGILTHLQRKEQAVEAEYSVIPDDEGDVDSPKEGEN